MAYVLSIGLKEFGGLTISPWEKSPTIIQGTHVKLGIILSDSSGRTVNTQPYTVKLRIPQGSGTFVTKTTTAVNFTGGEHELALLPADTLLLGVGTDQDVELEVALVSSPTTVAYIVAKKAFSVALPRFV